MQILAVGAAAPGVAARRGRRRRGVGPARWPRARRRSARPTRTSSRSRPRPRAGALAASGLQTDIVDGLWWGTTRPPFAEGPSHAVLAAALGLLAPVGRRALLRLAALRHGGAARRGRRGRRRVSAGSRWSSPPTRSCPGRARRSRRAPARAPPRSCSSPTAAARRSAPASRARTRSSTATAATARPTTRDLYDPRLFREEIFLPIDARARRAARPRSTCAPGRSPTPTAGSAPPSRSSSASRPPASTAVYAALGDTGAAAALLGGIGALDARRRRRDRRLRRRPRHRRRRSTSTAPVPGAATVADARSTGGPRPYAEVLRARGQLVAVGRDGPDGRPAGERAVRARRRRDARPPRRPLRRLRHDQHPAVDPPALHRVRRREVRARCRSPAAARCTPSSSTTRCRRRSSPRCRSPSSTSTTARA